MLFLNSVLPGDLGLEKVTNVEQNFEYGSPPAAVGVGANLPETVEVPLRKLG